MCILILPVFLKTVSWNHGGLSVNGSEFTDIFYIDEYNLGTDVRLQTYMGNWDVYPFGKNEM